MVFAIGWDILVPFVEKGVGKVGEFLVAILVSGFLKRLRHARVLPPLLVQPGCGQRDELAVILLPLVRPLGAGDCIEDLGDRCL